MEKPWASDFLLLVPRPFNVTARESIQTPFRDALGSQKPETWVNRLAVCEAAQIAAIPPMALARLALCLWLSLCPCGHKWIPYLPDGVGS